MQKIKLNGVGKLCLAILTCTLLAQTTFGYDEEKVSYLDSVSSSYLEDTEEIQDNSLLNMYSIDAKAIEATFKLDSTPIITDSQARISLSLRDSDLRQVLRMIADKAGLNIVFDKSVNGKVTLDLNNVTLNEAFMIVFKSTQLTYFLEGNTITVMTLEAGKNLAYTRQNMTILPVKYVNAGNIADFLNSNLFGSNIFGLSSKPVVTSNPSTNQLVIFGSPSDVNAIKRILPVLDTKPMVNSFKVNHTTPAEMASLICTSLLYSKEDKVSIMTASAGTDDKITLGAGTVACRDKGFQEDSGSATSLSSFKANPLTIVFFPEMGKISTYGGSVEQVELVKNFIKEHDKKQLMAYLEIAIVELGSTDSKTFNNTWDLWTPFISLGFSGGTLTTKNEFLVWDRRYTSSKVSNNKALAYQLEYILKNTKSRVLTNPKIMVTSGKKVTIDMTKDYIKSATRQVMQNTGSQTPASQTTYEIGSDDGIMIEITPFISPDGYVSLNITPEIAVAGDPIKEAGLIAATLLSRTDLELKNIRVKDGETMVLAGLIKESDKQGIDKMPLLSDLPLIGAFFRSSNNQKARTELAIMITPHIVKDTEEASSEQIYDL